MSSPTVSFEYSEKLNRTTIGAELDGVVRFIVLKGLWRETDGSAADHYADLVTQQVRSAVRERDRIRSTGGRTLSRYADRNTVGIDMGLLGGMGALLSLRRFGRASR